MPGRLTLLLLSSVLTSAYPYVAFSPKMERRQAGARTNDVICSLRDYQGDEQFPPPVVITFPDGSTACGCASDIVQGGNGSYTQCNEIYPTFGQSDYADPGLRQNRCYLSDQFVAVCGTSCTPNTTPNDDGTCRPFNSASYTLQSPTTEFGSETALPPASTTTEQEWTESSSQNWDTWTSETWPTESEWAPSSEFVPDSASAASSAVSSSSPSSSSPPQSLAPVSESPSTQSSGSSRLSMGGCSIILFAGFCL